MGREGERERKGGRERERDKEKLSILWQIKKRHVIQFYSELDSTYLDNYFVNGDGGVTREGGRVKERERERRNQKIRGREK